MAFRGLRWCLPLGADRHDLDTVTLQGIEKIEVIEGLNPSLFAICRRLRAMALLLADVRDADKADFRSMLMG